jgi:hypothetical protein
MGGHTKLYYYAGILLERSIGLRSGNVAYACLINGRGSIIIIVIVVFNVRIIIVVVVSFGLLIRRFFRLRSWADNDTRLNTEFPIGTVLAPLRMVRSSNDGNKRRGISYVIAAALSTALAESGD